MSGTDTPEYKIIFRNQSKIADTISDINGLNDRIVAELYAREIVGRTVKEAAEVRGPDVTEIRRVRPVLDAILARIKGDKNMYYKVRDVLLSDTIRVDAPQLVQYLPEVVPPIEGEDESHKGVPEMATSQGTGADEAQNCVELRYLINDLRPVAAKWKTLGIELEVPMEDLKEIGARFVGEDGKAQACLQRVVDHWLENSTRPPTGEVLKEVLEAVGHRRQANELSEDLLSATDLNSPKKLKLVMQELRKVAAQYHAVGIQLSIAPGTIREFEVEAGGHVVKQYLHEVIVHWLGSGDQSPDILVKSLKEIGYRRLAEKLEKDYKGKKIVLKMPEPKKEGE